MFPGATVKEELHLIFRLMGKRWNLPQIGAGANKQHSWSYFSVRGKLTVSVDAAALRLSSCLRSTYF